MVDVEGFLPTEQLRPTFWESTQAMFGHNYDSQYEAFREDLEFNTKGYARPFIILHGFDWSKQNSVWWYVKSLELMNKILIHSNNYKNIKIKKRLSLTQTLILSIKSLFVAMKSMHCILLTQRILTISNLRKEFLMKI